MPDRVSPRLALVSGRDREERTTVTQEADEPIVLRRAHAPGGGEYQARPDGTFFVHAEVETHIANFDAQLVRRARRGARTDLVLAIRIGDVEREITLDSSRYESLRWITDSVPGGVLAPVPAARARLLAAIALLSSPTEVAVLDRLGWFRDEHGRSVYAHAGGGIGEHGTVALDVQVDPPLDRFTLPESGDVAVTTPLELLGLLPDATVIAMLSAVVRAALGTPTFCLHLVGTTGTGKSQAAAALGASFFGAMPTGSELPVSWASTANAIELITHAAQGIVVVDDWVPATKQGSEEEMDRLLRSAANAGGRARVGSPARPPRALIVSTGEATPRLPSLVARMIVLRLQTGDMNWARLTEAQRRAREGMHARWMAAFLRWCAPRLDELRERLDTFAIQGRSRWSSFDLHARTVDALAELAGAWRILASYLWCSGGLELPDVESLVRRGEQALVSVAREQRQAQLVGEPVKLFLASLREVIDRGAVCLSRGAGKDVDETARVVGWIRDHELLLDPPAAVSAVQDHLRERGVALDLSEQQLGRLLRERGHLVRVDVRGAKVRYAVRATVGGARQRVWVLRAEALGLEKGEPSGPR